MFACQEKPFLLGIAWEKSIATSFYGYGDHVKNHVQAIHELAIGLQFQVTGLLDAYYFASTFSCIQTFSFHAPTPGRLDSLVTIRERAITGGPLTAF